MDISDTSLLALVIAFGITLARAFDVVATRLVDLIFVLCRKWHKYRARQMNQGGVK